MSIVFVLCLHFLCNRFTYQNHGSIALRRKLCGPIVGFPAVSLQTAAPTGDLDNVSTGPNPNGVYWLTSIAIRKSFQFFCLNACSYAVVSLPSTILRCFIAVSARHAMSRSFLWSTTKAIVRAECGRRFTTFRFLKRR